MTHILSLSYGKDSLACLEACKLLGYPIDRVIHAEVWATQDIPADLPPMVEFKKKADAIIKEKYGLIEQGNLAEWCEGWRQVATVTVENLRLSESD